MTPTGQSSPRVSVDGKFFRLGNAKFFVKGVAYGPFAPNAAGQPWPSVDQTTLDFQLIRELGANVVRVYYVPPKWILDLAQQYDLKVLVDVPWNKHLCFLDDAAERETAREAVRRAVMGCARHPAVFALSMANEIPADVVRWHGAQAIADFIDELVAHVKAIDPDCLCTFTNFPPTEFLRPQNLDFVCFNVYLHNPQPFRNYLARLQMIADTKPLMLGEFGIDSLREGEERKCEILAWSIEAAFRAGLAGTVLFSFTDDWWCGGSQITDWQMGLTTVDRQPKASFQTVKEKFMFAPFFLLPQRPKVSIVVASYNGDRTLKACLDSLERLNYSNYEVILVDDGSTDTTPQIVFTGRSDGKPETGGTFPMFSDKPGALKHFSHLRYVRHAKNAGLSIARNTGIIASTGEIIAFTDSDCRVDEDWLYYLVGEMLSGKFAAMGGPNFLPRDDSAVAAAVMVSPGGPAHVMLDDHQAEHIPGCNMAFWRWALDEIGGFDPIFKQAGDDVDVCWRLEQAGFKIGFSPAAMVWHYRRSTLAAYLGQQRGYGEAEALLVRKHPEYFNSFGGSLWRGRIYTASKFGLLVQSPIIYRGTFGSSWFQTLYTAAPDATLMLATTLEYQVLIVLPLWVLAVTLNYLLPVAIAATLIPVLISAAAGKQAFIPYDKQRWWSRPLVAALFFLQPIVRGWARYQGRLTPKRAPSPQHSLDSLALVHNKADVGEVCYRSEQRVDRLQFVADLVRRLEAMSWPNKSDIGWSEYDVELFGNYWNSVQLTTATEDHHQGRCLVRARLAPRWTLEARVAFWALLALEVVALGLWQGASAWRWLILFSVLPVVWFIRHQARHLQSMIVIFLDEAAKDRNLTNLRKPEATTEPPPIASKETAPSPGAEPRTESPFV